MGSCAAPQDCFLALRGIKTLAVRIEEHARNALAIAVWLSRHSKVERVLHPGLESHPQHRLALRQMSGYGGTISFQIRGGQDAALRALSGVRVFTLAESLGGVESLIEHPATMTHVSMPSDVREAMGISGGLVRVSVSRTWTTSLTTWTRPCFVLDAGEQGQRTIVSSFHASLNSP